MPFVFYMPHSDLEMERSHASSALHDFLQHVTEHCRNGWLLSRMLHHNAETEGPGIHNLQSILHFLCRHCVANEKLRVAGILESLHVLRSKSSLDEVAQTSDELSQGSKPIAKLLDFAPRNVHTHLVVTSTKPAMRETHSTTGICSKIPAPVSHIVTVCGAQIIDQQVLQRAAKVSTQMSHI
jgi:hypothetical protein